MFSLSLPGITVTSIEFDQTGQAKGVTKGVIVLNAVCEGKPDCPHCLAANPYVHGTLKQEFLDYAEAAKAVSLPLPDHLERALNGTVHIHLARKRWKCTACTKTFLHPLPWLDEDQSSTNRFIEHLATTALEKNFSELSREFGIHEKTVRRIFYRYYQEVDAARIELPRFMGIGTMTIAGMSRPVIMDLSKEPKGGPEKASSTFADSLALEYLFKPDVKTFEAFVQGLKGQGQTGFDQVEFIVTGFDPDYRESLQEHFPKALVIIDATHMEALANEVVDAVRKAVRDEIKSGRTKAKLKDAKALLRLHHPQLGHHALLLLKSWREEFPLIGFAFDQKEALHAIYECKDRQDAKDRLDVWRQSIPVQMKPYWTHALERMGNWEEEVLNFFELPVHMRKAYQSAQEVLAERSLWLQTHTSRGHSFEALRIKLRLGGMQ